MSTAVAIEATTATLLQLLHDQIPARIGGTNVDITTMPPDIARKGKNSAQLNIFLYQTAINAAWRNLDVPNQVHPGETGNPPLALNLHYMLTAYGDANDDETVSHRVLGGAMSVLHDHPVLSAADIGIATAKAGLETQFERLRITPIALPMDEMSKLWTALQTNYRLSAGYEVTVLLIDSTLPVKASLPVLRRGPEDRGPQAVAGRAPSLSAVRYPASHQAALLGDDIAIVGAYLGVANTTVQFSSARLKDPITLAPVAGDRTGEIKVHLPSLAEDASGLSKWVPGQYTVSVVVAQASGPALVSNEIAFALAPTIMIAPGNWVSGPADLTFTLTCVPHVNQDQRLLMLLGHRQSAWQEPNPFVWDATKPWTGDFVYAGLPAETRIAKGTYTVRLRVDGVDSIPVVLSATTPHVPVFDPTQQVTIG